jgi:hypothetical protein
MQFERYLQETLAELLNEQSLSKHLKTIGKLLFETNDDQSGSVDLTGFDPNMQDFALSTVENIIPSRFHIFRFALNVLASAYFTSLSLMQQPPKIDFKKLVCFPIVLIKFVFRKSFQKQLGLLIEKLGLP